MSGKDLPKVIDKSPEEIAQAIDTIEKTDLPDSMKSFIIACINLAVWLPSALLEKKISLSNLRKLIFGNGKSGRSKKKGSNKQGTDDKPDEENQNTTPDPETSEEGAPPEGTVDPDIATTNSATNESESNDAQKKPGHGRNSHEVYTHAVEHQLQIDGLAPGNFCPTSCGGRLYQYQPGILVRIKGQHWASAHKYIVEKLRCSLCGILITAPIPDDVGKEKYDAGFKAILTIQKYYIAVPFYRQAYFQSLINIPLAPSTQWDLIQEVATPAFPVFHELERLAANGDIIHSDDTYLKILRVIKDNRDNPDKSRTGMFTTGILSKTENHQIALFYNGTRHAGENMDRLLEKRQPTKPAPIYMCDALSRNIPERFKTILCNCLSHGVRKFNDLKDFFPDECIVILEGLSDVYENDDKTTDMTPNERLAYHKKHSAPIMQSLKDYMTGLLDNKQVEPNGHLGKAVKYMLKHWHELTQFLRVAKAPLDNNIMEQMLKIPIRGRRTWLFYKTEYGAMIGGVLTSVIHTCALAGENPIDYLIALQKNKHQVVKEPSQWLPWNYRQQLEKLSDAA